MKKMFTMLLAMMMCLSLFGCGAEQQAAETSPTVESSETAADVTPEVSSAPSEAKENDVNNADASEETNEVENAETETPESENAPSNSDKDAQQAVQDTAKQEQNIPAKGNEGIEENVEDKNNQRDTYVTDGNGQSYYVDENGDYWLDITGGSEADGYEAPDESLSFYEQYGFEEGSHEHLCWLFESGENPIRHGFRIFAEDTGREITAEELDSFLKVRDPFVDDYLDSEHNQGLY